MSDLLSSASLLIAIVTVLYALWYPEIKRAIDEIKPGEYREPRDIKKVSGILLLHALPLALASLCLTLVFMKDTFIILRNSLSVDLNLHSRIASFDAVSTAFVLVETICAFLSFVIVVQCLRVIINLIRLLTTKTFDPSG